MSGCVLGGCARHTGVAAQENLPPFTLLATITTADPNLLDPHTYAIVPPPAPSPMPPFLIVGNTLVTNSSLNFEVTPTISVTIQSFDDLGLSVTKTLVITVLDANDPPTGAYVLDLNGRAVQFVDENVPIPTTVGVIYAIDEVGLALATADFVCRVRSCLPGGFFGGYLVVCPGLL